MLHRVAATTLWLLTLSLAWGNTGPERVVYRASEFDKYAPQTALDMVERVPGFTIDEGADLRGFGGTAGNVLIDGQRPSSKSGGVRDALRRVPASQVDRIEVLRGAAITAEAQGQTIVVNVVTRKAAATGTWSLELERAGDAILYPHGDASYSTPIGEWDTAFKLNAIWERWPYRGRREVYDGAGTLRERWQDNRPMYYAEAYASGEASRAIAGGLFRVNARFGWEEFYYDNDSLIFLQTPDDAVPEFSARFSYDSQTVRAEIGADFSRLIADDWTWKVVALASGKVFNENQRNKRLSLPDQIGVSQTELGLDQKPAELIARTTFSRGGDHVWRPQFGIEAAFNRLDSALGLVVGGVPFDLPASNVLVQELRGEVFANAAWKLDPALTLEGGIAVEVSRIEVSGDAQEEQAFVFWKPALGLTWAAGPKTQLRAGVRHTVGQLDFTDFAASAQVQDNIPIAGNPSLKPTQMTRAYAALDHRWGTQGAFALEVFAERRKDVIEYVILPSGAEGLGNAGEADVWGLIASVNLPLAWLIDGAKLRASAKVTASRFEDPLTGQTRDINALATPVTSAEFRHDIPGAPWAWGLTFTGPTETVFYFVDEIDAQPFSERYGAFVETVIEGGVKLVLTVRDANTQRWRRQRLFFDPDRGDMLDRIDKRWNTRGAFVNLTASASF